MRYQILEFDGQDNYEVSAEAHSLEYAEELFRLYTSIVAEENAT